jgi:prepilin-type N-terminal cleavage/methylation domain-containing protein
VIIKNYRNNFSLIEVLVALTIIAVSFSTYMRALSLNIKNTNVSKSYITANLLANKKLTELANSNGKNKEDGESKSNNDKKNKIVEGKKQGDFGYDYPGFTWESEIKKQSKCLYSLELSVSFLRMGEIRTLTFNTLLFDKAALKKKTVGKDSKKPSNGEALKKQ